MIRKELSLAFSEQSRKSDFWVNCLLYLSMGFIFWPITQWFAQSAQAQSRLLHAFIVLLLASVLLVRFGNIRIEAPLRLNQSARKAMYLTFAVMLAQFLGRYLHPSPWISLLGIPAYCCGLASLFLFVFGERARRIIITTTGTFGLFLFLSTVMDSVDWPLRTIAGQLSGWVLTHLGQAVQLGIHDAPAEPAKLILLVNQHPFHVAPECNGFGVIMTCLLLSFLLAIYQSAKLHKFALYLLAGITLGFFFNTLRIVCIVMLAPKMMEHYHLMHEIVGTITYWSALIVTWKLLGGPTNYPTATEAAAAHD